MTLEEAFLASEAKLREVEGSLKDLRKAVESLSLALSEGDLILRRKANERAIALSATIAQSLLAANGDWPEAAEEEGLVNECLIPELKAVLTSAGRPPVQSATNELRLFPHVVSVNAKARSVRIDGRPVRCVRPPALGLRMCAPADPVPEELVEPLRKAYLLIAGRDGDLVSVYGLLEALTLWPPSPEAPLTEQMFASALVHMFQRQVRTKDGKVLELVGSTAIKQGDGIAVVNEAGRTIRFSAIRYASEPLDEGNPSTALA